MCSCAHVSVCACALGLRTGARRWPCATSFTRRGSSGPRPGVPTFSPWGGDGTAAALHKKSAIAAAARSRNRPNLQDLILQVANDVSNFESHHLEPQSLNFVIGVRNQNLYQVSQSDFPEGLFLTSDFERLEKSNLACYDHISQRHALEPKFPGLP